MRTGWKRGLVAGMTFCLAVSSLAGCGKKEAFDAAAAAATLDGETVSAGEVNFLLRYQQAGMEDSYRSLMAALYGSDTLGSDFWSQDIAGTGEAYGVTFKNEIMNDLEKLLLAEKHMADYGVELTDEDKAAVTEAAKGFIESNSEETLAKMSATQENVERILTLYAIRAQVEEQMSADVDTEVSDEEAAQRTVAYVSFYPSTDEEDEDIIEDETAGEEDAAEEGAESLTEEDAAEADAESLTEADAEETSEAELTEEDATKTEAADTEAETEAADTEAETEEAADTDTPEAETAAAEEETDVLVEEETETEDPAAAAANEAARAKAEAFLEIAKTADDFAAAAEEATENEGHAYTGSFTIGPNDTYPDEAIISATEGLDDNTLVEQVVEANGAYYVLYVTDAFDEDATEAEKENIVEQRKQDAVNALYDEWIEASEFTVDEAVYGELLFNISFTRETEAAAEEAASEEAAEDGTEAGSEEAETSAEEQTEAPADDTAEAAETETEAAAAEAETEAAETEEATEAVTE